MSAVERRLQGNSLPQYKCTYTPIVATELLQYSEVPNQPMHLDLMQKSFWSKYNFNPFTPNDRAQHFLPNGVSFIKYR